MLTQGAVPSGIDEDDLDEELADLQQEVLDEKMLKTGTVPVSDSVQRLPNVAVGEGGLLVLPLIVFDTLWPADLSFSLVVVRGKAPARHVQEEDDEEEELRKLQAEMAM